MNPKYFLVIFTAISLLLFIACDDSSQETTDGDTDTVAEGDDDQSSSTDGDDEVADDTEDLVEPFVAPMNLIPLPKTITENEGVFVLRKDTPVTFNPSTDGLKKLAGSVADILNAATGGNTAAEFGIVNELSGEIHVLLGSNITKELDSEGYILDVSPDGILLAANAEEGIFRGIQTLRQLLPVRSMNGPADAPYGVAACKIVDNPRFRWRGFMLDVARHFFDKEEVKRLIDKLSAYKINVLHLHLTDDQGWRIQIDSWPNLTLIGGSSEVGGGPGGYYTKDDYREIVDYAQAHYMLVVPEVDFPGHVNAALASYAELSCDGVAPPLYTGVDVGFSSLCLDKNETFTFLEDVLREISEMTPGPYVHVGGDEARDTSADDYQIFIAIMEKYLAESGKSLIGWEEVYGDLFYGSSVMQIWLNTLEEGDYSPNAPVILSPAPYTYLDMMHSLADPYGAFWAGFIPVEKAYNWEPLEVVEGLGRSDVMGIEAPLWTEGIADRAAIDYLVFPRILGLAEVGWSSRESRDWEDFRKRLAAHGPRLGCAGIGFFSSPDIDWAEPVCSP